MKKIIYMFIGLFVSVVLLAVVAANSAYVIKKAAAIFAPDYNISYVGISGNILTGVTIEYPKFSGKALAKALIFRWNPSKLLYGQLAVSNIEIQQVNVDTLKALTKAFPASPEENQSTPFPFSVSIGRLHMDTVPFEELGVRCEMFGVDAQDIFFESDSLQVGDMRLHLDTNITDVRMHTALLDGKAMIKRMQIRRLDTKALVRLVSTVKREENRTQAVENHCQEEKPNPLIPHTLVVDVLDADILPAVYRPVHLHGMALSAKKVHIDIPHLVAISGTIDLNGTTNLSNISEHMKIHDNHFNGHIVLTPNQPLFDLYAPMVRKEAIGDIVLDFNASTKRIHTNIHAKAKHLLLLKQENNETKPVAIDIDPLRAEVTYELDNGLLSSSVDMSVKSPLSEGVRLHAYAQMKKGVWDYNGTLESTKILLGNGKALTPINGLKISVSGDDSHLHTTIDAAELQGYFTLPDINKSGTLHLETKEKIALKEMFTLPDPLNEAAFGVTVDLPLNLKQPLPLHATVQIRSNLADVDANISYDKEAKVMLKSTIPQDSLLREVDKHIRWDALSPLQATINVGKEEIRNTLRSHEIAMDMRLFPERRKVTGEITLAGVKMTIDTQDDGTISVRGHVDSIGKVFESINAFYHLEPLPSVDGEVNMVLSVTKDASAQMTLSSPKMIYYADRSTTHEIDAVKIVLYAKEQEIRLLSYDLTYNKMRLFSTKPSIIALQKDQIQLKALWLNDTLNITGDIDPKQMKGKIIAKGENVHVQHEMIDLRSNIDLVVALDGNHTDIQGKVLLLGGEIHYDMDTRQFPSDSDILVVQRMKQKGESPFMDNLTMNIRIDTKSPLKYRQGPFDIKADVGILVSKAVLSRPLVTGSIDIIDGSSYTFQRKKFVLERSHIYFTGEPNKPLLDLTAKYQALRHLISINITGTPAAPNILFSSVPSLTKEQILSIILFDSEEGANNNSGDDMMKMMGGAMAKAALNDLGVEIDHLVIGEGNSVEVGKKLIDKITVIYISGEMPRMEMKYQYSPSVEVVIGAGEQSQSVDVIYIKDFNMKKDEGDIVIKGR